MGLAPGSTVERYEVVSLLGSGGMADVYVVRHRTLGAARALKVLRHGSGVLRERLVREGRAQAALQHPNVVQVLDVIEVGGAPGLVLELVDGPTLASLIGPGLPLGRAERYLGQVCQGLRAAHAAGVVHRDLKPANVLVDRGDVARVTDFGLAALLAEAPTSKLTRPGASIGTPTYMAPEQFDGSGRVDARTDVWALGVLAYELLTGATPADGLPLAAGWHRMLERTWRPVDTLVEGLPARVARAIGWALEPSVDARCPSVDEFWSAFSGRAALETVILPPPPSFAPRPTSPTWVASTPPSVVRLLVGRAEELARAWDLLDARGGLVTLVGTGGVGKTRLAAELHARWLAGDREATWVDLEPARTEVDVVHRVGFAIGDVGDGSIAGVGRALSRRSLLLVLDNLEQLPREVQRVFADWMRHAPSLRILGTSRQAVGVSGEQVVEVSPLPLPEDGDARDLDAWRVLQHAAPKGVLDRVGAELARDLLAALEGLPLALELAAARLEVLEPAELLARLARRFDVLADPDAGGTRHGALRDTIGWSWTLLAEHERRALAALSVFRGPIPLAGAEAVVGTRALDALHGLVRRNLLRRASGRFSLLGSIRDFAAEQLSDEERREARRRHAAWVAAACAPSWSAARRGEPAAIDALEELLPEVWAALDHAAADPALVPDAWRAADASTALYRVRGPLRALLALCDAALALAEEGRPSNAASLEGMLHVLRGFALRRTGRPDEARRALDRALALAGPAPSEARALALAHLADLLVENGGEPVALYEEAVTVAEAHGPRHIVRTGAAALATFTAGDRAASEAWWRRSEAASDPRDRVTELAARKQRAWLLLSWDELVPARDAYRAILPLAEELGDRRTLAYVEGQLGLVAEALGELPDALARFDRVVAFMRDQGDESYAAWYQGFRARVLARLDRFEDAVRDASAAARADGEPGEIARWLVAALERRAGPVAASSDPVLDALGEAFAAHRGGDRAGTAAACARVRASLSTGAEDRRAFVEHLLSELSADAWRFAGDGSWFEAPGLERADTSRHAAYSRILAHLVARRLEAPGDASDVTALASAGWPGERIVPKAAGNRVRVALSALRQLGLEPIVQREAGGWRLDPAIPIRR